MITCSTMTTTRFLIAASVLLEVAKAQFDFPASTEPCPSDGSITGYTSISAMNTDMQAEIDRIDGGGGFDPDRTYSMILCPQTNFDTDGEALTPLLNGVQFMCGPDGDVANGCVLGGGGENVDIRDPSIDNYDLTSISFQGLTFEDFSGRSIDLATSDTTTVTFTNSVWQNFDSTNLFRIRNNNGPTVGNLEIIGGEISGPNANAQLVFRNEGGSVLTNGLTVQDVDVDVLFENENGGTTTIQETLITNSEISTVVNSVDGSTSLSGVEVSSISRGMELFVVSNDAQMDWLNVDVVGNTGVNNNFQILRVVDDGSVVIRNATFEENTGVRNIMLALGDENSPTNPSILFSDTDFIRNTNNVGSENVFIRSEGNDALISMTRINFVENTDGLGLIAGMFGGDIEFTNVCFFRNNNQFVALALEGSDHVAFDNYVEDEVSVLCGGIEPSESGGRMSVEIPGSRCFRPDATMDCLVDCTQEANDLPQCGSGLQATAPPSTSSAPTGGGLPATDPPSESTQPTGPGTPPPSVSVMPSVSSSPTFSGTFPPTVSQAPSTSNQPTFGDTNDPTVSQMPSVSVAPSVSSSPSTTAPTVAITDFPSVSMFPTISFQPSASVFPSAPPTIERIQQLTFDRSGLFSDMRDNRPHEDDSGEGDDGGNSDDSGDGRGKGKGKGKGKGAKRSFKGSRKRGDKLFENMGKGGKGGKRAKRGKRGRRGKGKGFF